MYGTAMMGLLGGGGGGFAMHLNAGNILSYDGTSQTWANLDPPSDGLAKTAYDVYRGNDSVSGSDDPTFNGVAGDESVNEYFSFDGSQYFTLKSGTNTSFINSWHKNNAAFTAIFWLETPAILPSNGNTLFATCDATGTSDGVACQLSNAGNMSFTATRSGALEFNESTATGFVTAGDIQMLAVSVNEAADEIIFYNNGDTEILSCTYTNPTSANAEQKLFIFGRDSGNPMANGYKLWDVKFRSNALTAAQLNTIFNAEKAIYGL